MSSVPVKIQRISRTEYSFRLSSAEGVRYVIRALTFDNPDPYAYSPHIEKFSRSWLTFPVGMIRTLRDSLDAAAVGYQIEDYDFSLPDGVEIDGRMAGTREYQADAVREWYKRRWGIIVVPTRGGKTFIAAEIARIFLATERDGNILFVVDNTTLFTQAVDDFHKFWIPYGGIEVGEIRAGRVDFSKRLTVGMIQTIQSTLRSNKRARRVEMEKYLRELKFLAVDEVHENCSDSRLKTYKRCRKLEYQLCLSATPYRAGAFVQNLKLMAWSGDVVYEITEDRLRENGVLSDYRVFILLLDHNNFKYPGLDEYDYADCRRRLIFENRFRNMVLKQLVDGLLSQGLKILVLFQSIEHGARFAEMMGGIPFLSGRSKGEEREAVKRDFLAAEGGSVLLASNIFKKGVTLPEAQVVINADEGLEEANVVQKKGRVLGTTADKSRSLVVDFFDLYDAYFSDHSEARLNTYIDAVGEEKVGIVDVSVEGWLELILDWSKKWFQISD